ncbi:DUF1295 domain-containing protein [Galbitalea sp. SE-J8]|uniref:DUF1295 domain-containing protein n=1 Tax=Galbitalea sp. SE-J8 TaxID=3054952 RepID=UPI00259C9F4F|nr:DUF1295 domain-containing protein [Galbitalea sp. SE-J8]MDM4764298.1 DUF1295 domain-containing protein [Galbitalea sp. SE-J8]
MTGGWYAALVALQFVLAAATLVALRWIVAPYGRHARGGWGPTIPARVGWIVMEAPASVLFIVFFLLGDHRGQPVPIVLLALWQLHYVNRAFVTPLLTRSSARMPVLVAALAITFNTLNAWINARWVSQLGDYPLHWLADPRFVVGVVVMLAGLAINVHSDAVLRALRREHDGYAVPRRGAFRWISSPNYAGEIVEWCGWALLTWSPAGLAFAVYTIANLAPRAIANHRWYRETFPDYPPERRALIPGLL